MVTVVVEEDTVTNNYTDEYFEYIQNNGIILNNSKLDGISFGRIQRSSIIQLTKFISSGDKKDMYDEITTIINSKSDIGILEINEGTNYNLAEPYLIMTYVELKRKTIIPPKKDITDDLYKKYRSFPLTNSLEFNVGSDLHHESNLLYNHLNDGWCKSIVLSYFGSCPTRYLTKSEFIDKLKSDNKFRRKFGNLR